MGPNLISLYTVHPESRYCCKNPQLKPKAGAGTSPPGGCRGPDITVEVFSLTHAAPALFLLLLSWET